VTVPSRPGAPAEVVRRGATRRLLFFMRLSFAVVGLWPWLVPLARAWLPLGPIGLALDAPFVLICHRQPARTLELAGVAMPLCSRCAGIFLGLAAGAIAAWPRFGLKAARIALAAAALLMIADVATQDLGLHPSWHSTRLATGILLGWVASAALCAAIVRERHAMPVPREETS
jgi:uncharacterized membrane protein